MNEQLYKLTAADGSPVHGGSGKWPVPTEAGPGKWRSVRGDLGPCSVGLHLLRVADIPTWLRAGVLWEVEAGDERIDHGDKIVVRKARLVRRAAVIDDTTLRLLAPPTPPTTPPPARGSERGRQSALPKCWA